MRRKKSVDNDKITEAIRWVTGFEIGAISEADEKKYQQWLAADPSHGEAIETARRISRRARVGARQLAKQRFRNADTDQTTTAMLPQAAPARSHTRRRVPFAIAASVSALVAAGWFMFATQEYHRTYVTGIGEHAAISLPDDSLVDINTNSLVEIHYTAAERNVTVLRGEVHFEVASDWERPFNVKAGASRVRAVGTAFNVHLQEDSVEIMVIEGIVSVIPAQPPTERDVEKPQSGTRAITEAATVVAGKKLEINDSLIRVESIDQEQVARKLAWRDGLLVFSEEPLVNVVAEVNRYTEKKLIIADPQLEQQMIGGTFRADDIDEILGLWEQLGIVTVRSSPYTIYLSAPAS